MKIQVSIVMGSDSDLPVMNEATGILKEQGIGYDVQILSAHRTPEELKAHVRKAVRGGVKVFIAAAGGAAHLPGVVASLTSLPVIGVPISSELKGLDSLLSIVQMPRGIPVATVAIGKAGAANSAILAMEILGVSDAAVARKLQAMRSKMRAGVLARNRAVQKQVARG